MDSKLKKQHDIVKNHPYRLNHDTSLWKSFYNELDLLETYFYEACKERDIDCFHFCHELLACARHIQSDIESDMTIDHGEVIRSVELGIAAIHKFIETGEFLEYYYYYLGCNYDRSRGRSGKCVKKGSRWVVYKPVNGNWIRRE